MRYIIIVCEDDNEAKELTNQLEHMTHASGKSDEEVIYYGFGTLMENMDKIVAWIDTRNE